MDPKGELHIFVAWENARNALATIRQDLKRRFEVEWEGTLQWSRDHFADNLSRFYGQSLPPGSDKARHCGLGPFEVFIVRDPQPRHELRRTSSGPRIVNGNVFEAKIAYRGWTGGGHRVHSSVTPKEARRDIMLMLHCDVRRGVLPQGGADGRPWELDVVGAHGWRDLRELFRTLDAGMPYVVLRNFENLPESPPQDGDIDILVEDKVEAALMLGGKRVHSGRRRAAFSVPIGGSQINFDVRSIGDGYMDARWQRDILACSIEWNGIRVPDPLNHYFSLAYHAAIQKPGIHARYQKKLEEIAIVAGMKPDTPVLANLTDFLRQRGYSTPEPEDPSVLFRPEVLGRSGVSLGWRGRRLVHRARQKFGAFFGSVRDGGFA